MSSDNDHGRTMDKPDITTQAGQGQGQQEPSDEQGKEKEADIEVRNTVFVWKDNYTLNIGKCISDGKTELNYFFLHSTKLSSFVYIIFFNDNNYLLR